MTGRSAIGVPALLAGLLLGLGGCEGAAVVTPDAEEPFLYLVLNDTTFDQLFAGTIGQHALLTTVRGVLEPPRFRSAERFEMRPESRDGTFQWVQYESGMETSSYPALSLTGWNFHLPETAGPDSLSASDIRPGGSYSLVVETGGILIQGATTVPAAFTIRVSGASSGTDSPLMSWSPVPGAAGYRIEVPDREVRLQRDTTFAAPPGIVPTDITVVALDENLYRYSRDPQLRRAGINAGLGVFGAISTGSHGS